MTFEKWTGKQRKGRSPSEFAELKIGECYFTDKEWSKLYRQVYHLEKTTEKVFEYMEIKNGYVVKRIK